MTVYAYDAEREIALGAFAGLLDPEMLQGAYVQTTDATVTNLWTYTVATDETISILVIVNGTSANNAVRAGYLLFATAADDSGILAQVGTTAVLATNEEAAAWDATIDISAAQIRIRVTGAAGVTINWTATILIQKYVS